MKRINLERLRLEPLHILLSPSYYLPRADLGNFKHPHHTMRKILYIDMDNVLVDFASAFPLVPSAVLKEYEHRLDEIPGIFALMKPMPDAIASFNQLCEKYDTYILSTSPWENPSAWSDKLVWVKTYLEKNAYKRLILSHHKNLNQGHFLVDDRSKNGVDKFQGEHLLFGSERFPNWSSVTEYLREQAHPRQLDNSE